MKRRWLRSIAVRVLTVAAALFLAGCTGSGSRSAAPGTSAASGVIHVVIQTQRETLEALSEAERIVVSGTIDVWADPSASMRRTTSESMRAGEPTWHREELVRDGVWSIYDPAVAGSPVEALQYDAPLADQHPPGPDDDPMRRGVLDAYRRWIASGEATITGSGEVSGTPTFRVEASSGTSLGGVILRADVRRSDYVPVRMSGERWNLIRGKREIAEQWSARYVVVETLPRGSVPSGTFEFEFPSGVVPLADFSVTTTQAVSFPSLKPRWLGASFGGDSLSDARLRYRSRPPVEFRFVGTFPSPYQLAESRRPDFATRWIQAEYGSRGVSQPGPPQGAPHDLIVLSYPKVPREKWPKFDKWAAVSTATVGGRPAVRATYTQKYGSNGVASSWLVTWVVLDLEDATVVIEGIGATPAELDSAVRSLRRVGE